MSQADVAIGHSWGKSSLLPFLIYFFFFFVYFFLFQLFFLSSFLSFWISNLIESIRVHVVAVDVRVHLFGGFLHIFFQICIIFSIQKYVDYWKLEICYMCQWYIVLLYIAFWVTFSMMSKIKFIRWHWIVVNASDLGSI